MNLSRQEFETLALEQLDMLYRIARRLTRDPGRAEDLVQDTYLRAFRAMNEFTLHAHGIRPWLVRIMHNVHYTHSQRERRQPATVEDVHIEQASRVEPEPIRSDTAANFDNMDERLVRAIEELAEEYQVVLLLWAVEDFTYREIAEALEVPIGTVMSRLYRARGKLSERLADFARQERIIRE